jgi:hypothetical protein
MKQRYTKHIIGVVICMLMATVALAQWANILQVDATGIKVGTASRGTKLNLIEAYDLAFTGDTISTAATNLPTDATYYVAHAWKSATGAPGLSTASVTEGTLTGTAANATTGTMSVLIFGAP